MKDRGQRAKGKGQRAKNFRLYALCSMLLVLCSLLAASILYAQEEKENEGEDRIIDLPPVSIEIVDTTQVNIPREKFRSFTRPDSRVYAPLSPKERPWYFPSISVPGKLREVPSKTENDFLFSLAAHSGVPAALAYQMLLVREFDSSEALLNMRRLTLRSERTPKLASDTSKGQGSSTVDSLRGAFAHQSENSSLKMDVQYNAKDLGYLDKNGEEYPNDRALVGLSMDWDRKLSGNAQSSLSIGLSSLKMGDPLSSESHTGLDLKTDFGIRALWPRSNPIDAGLGIVYFAAENDSAEFRESIVRLYLRDNCIRIWPFVLGTGLELVLDARKSSRSAGIPDREENWKPNVYLYPCMLLTSQIGDRTVLQFGVEGHILTQNLKEFYLDRDYVRLNPDLNAERAWNLNTSLQYRLTRKFTVNVGAFGKEIKNLTIFEETNDGILSWIPSSRDSKARIFGFSSGWELSLMDGRVKQTFQYIHEEHDQNEYIPYRPKDRGDLTIAYSAPFGLEISLSGEFYGTRYIDTSGKTLSGYSLWGPRISKTFGRYASAFLAAEFYVGQDDYQAWEEYELPSQIVDFGLMLKF